MTPQLEIAIAAFALAIGTAGMPLAPLRVLIALLICLVVWRSGKFVGSLAMLAVIACSYLQHGTFRVTSLVAAALLGILAHLLYRKQRATTAIMAVAVLAGAGFFFFS